jgi:hypothetical protein
MLTDAASGITGGHVIFSHYRYFDKLLDHVTRDWCERERVCYVWQKERFIPYPFQNNIHRCIRRATRPS